MSHRIDQSEAIERIEGVLKAAGITVSIKTSTTFIAEFPDGAWVDTVGPAGFAIECDGLSYQRG